MPQFESISSSVLSFLYGSTLTSICDYWKSHILTVQKLVNKIMSLLFNVLFKKPENSRKTSASLSTLKPLTVWITRNWTILKEMGIPDHLTCLLRNLYAGQEATVRIRHGTTDWFQIGKGIHQGYILSPYLFNLLQSIS